MNCPTCSTPEQIYDNLDHYYKEITDLQDLLQCIIDIHDNGYDMPTNIRTFEKYLEESKVRFPNTIKPRYFTCCWDQGGHSKDETCDMWRAHQND
jgi:hypothetical protein